MIRYLDAAQKVIARTADDGHVVILEPWSPGWDEAVAAGPIAYEAPAADMAALRAEARVRVVALLTAAQAAITGDVPPAEMASWPAKAAAARAWLADQSQPAPLLIAGEAAKRGRTAVQVATRITQKAAVWEAVIAAHTGLRGNAEDTIDAATTPLEIDAALDALRAALT